MCYYCVCNNVVLTGYDQTLKAVNIDLPPTFFYSSAAPLMGIVEFLLL